MTGLSYIAGTAGPTARPLTHAQASAPVTVPALSGGPPYAPGVCGPSARPLTFPQYPAGSGFLTAQATVSEPQVPYRPGIPGIIPGVITGLSGPEAQAEGTGTLTAGAQVTYRGTAALAATGTLTGLGGVPIHGSAAMSGAGQVTAAGTATGTFSFIIAVACGDSDTAGLTIGGAGWQALATVQASDGTGHTADCVLAAAVTTSSAAVTATATSARQDISGMITGVVTAAPSPVPSVLNQNWPYTIVEAAFGSGYMTPADEMEWVNIQSVANGKRLRSWKNETTGIQYELGGLQSTEAALALDNPDGNLSPFNPSSPWYPDIVPGTPIRYRAVPPASTGVNAWCVIQRNMEHWPQSWDSVKRGQVNGSATDVWSVIARPVASCYRAEVLQDQPGWWWPCDDPAVIPLPGSLVNAAPGSTSRLQILSSPNGLSETISGYPFASGFAYSAVQSYAANSGWMYGDSLSASWEQDGNGSVTAGRYLACNDPDFPPLSGGVTISGWWKLPYQDTGGTAQRTTGPYTQPSGAITLWEIASESAALASLSLTSAGALQLTTGSATTTIVTADQRSTTWTGVTVTLTQSSWQAFVNGGVTAIASGTASMGSQWDWFLAGAGTGGAGAPPTAGSITGIGNVAHSHLEIYGRVLPASRIMAHFMAAYTGFGQMPAPSVTAQFVQNDHAAGGSSTYGPDGEVYSGSFFTPPGVGNPNNTLAAVGCMSGGGYTSAPSIPESVTVIPTGATVNGFCWLTADSPACPAVTWYTGSGSGAEKLAATSASNHQYVDSYGTGAAPPAAPSALGDTVQNRIERLLAAGLVSTPARCIDAAASPVVAALDLAGQACGQAVTNIVQSDGGLMWVDNVGNICYKDKPSLQADTVLWQLGEATASGLIPYETDAEFDTDPQQVKNQVEITQYNASPDVQAHGGGLSTGSGEAASGLTYAPDGSFYSAIQASVLQNGPVPYAITSYLQSTASIQAQCDYIIQYFGSPRQRITNLTINAASKTRTSPGAWLAVLAMNVGDLIQVTRTPPGQPSFTGIWRISLIKRTVDFAAGTASITLTADVYTPEYWG